MRLIFVGGIIFILYGGFPQEMAHSQSAASLFISPSGGTFTVGSTFAVSIFVNSGGGSVNAIEANLRFSADKLQVVSPTAGQSIFGIWVAQPTYDNVGGRLKFQGAIPTPGITTSQGLVSQITFRVTSVGTGSIRFEDTSKILLNDGKGTDVLGEISGGIYSFVLPPPAGPLVTSATHPDQETWYKNPTVFFDWTGERTSQGYSYVLNENPVDVPDDISEGRKESVIYKNLVDGLHYFHIKSLREGAWGGVTHYAVKIDTSPPAAFPITILPAPKTISKKISIDFATTDGLSGIEHYEIKVVALSPGEGSSKSEQALFVETQSPYVSELNKGEYVVIVRAYDKAGNYVEQSERISIVDRILNLFGSGGLRLRSDLAVPWSWVWGVSGFLILFFLYIAHVMWERHHHTHTALIKNEPPVEMKRQLEELKTLREKYKKLTLLILFGITSVWIYSNPGHAQTLVSPPIVTIVSRHISNQEIFYVGGTTEAGGSEITIYLQNFENGQTLSYATKAENHGEWFYSHPGFLGSGTYLLWTQAKVEGALSPPSPQIQLTVSPTALQFGASRVSREVMYLMISMVFLAGFLALGAFSLYHAYHHRRKRHKLHEEAQKLDASLKRGFAVLRRDIESELALVHKLKLQGGLQEEEKQREEAIMKDLERIKNYIGQEIWEIEQGSTE